MHDTADIETWINAIDDRDEAKKFVLNLWDAFWVGCDLGKAKVFFADQIELSVHAALRADNYGGEKRRCIPHLDWPAVIAVAEDMVALHYENEKYMDPTSRQLAYIWMPAMGDALR